MAQRPKIAPDLAGQQALETTDDLGFGPALGRPALVVGLGRLVVLQPDDDGPVERGVGLSVAAAVQPVPVGHPRRGRDRGDPAEPGERWFGLDPFGVVAGDDEHLGGDVGTDPERSDKIGNQLTGQLGQQLLVGLDLRVQGQPPSRDRPQGVFRCGRRIDNRAGPQRAATADQHHLGQRLELLS